ncbi:hypothetical protein ALC62_05398 [Cyphomyrmex costatus]|uniref:Uncharacterized protein n=1 Tax=Cyphomyrmex costatus TaxID=456900 RepID=A0A195CT54_9HYME|nr:hypothetical protein ALC62_05398 [Cyphomyrmex costatus]
MRSYGYRALVVLAIVLAAHMTGTFAVKHDKRQAARSGGESSLLRMIDPFHLHRVRAPRSLRLLRLAIYFFLFFSFARPTRCRVHRVS